MGIPKISIVRAIYLDSTFSQFVVSLLQCHVLLWATRKQVMLGRLLQENDKKMSKLDKLARDQDLLQQLQLHGLEGTHQGKLTKEVLTTADKKYTTSGGKLKVTSKKGELREPLVAALQVGE